MKVSKKIGLWLASLHTIGFIAMAIHINLLNDGQAPMLWLIFAFIDFPISLIYVFAGTYAKFYTELESSSFLAHILYFPYIIHGLLGGLWWYFLPHLIPKRKFGIRLGDCIDWNDIAKDKKNNNDGGESRQVLK